MNIIRLLLGFFLLSASLKSAAMFDDDPWLSKLASEFEYTSDNSKTAIEWDIDYWYGRDLSKFWIKSQGEYSHSEIESANVELVYSRAMSTNWDQQFGVRRDFKSEHEGENRDWLSFGFIGTAPYFIDVDARIFIDEEKSSQLFIELEKELMLSQQWVLTPELDIIANGRSNPSFGEGSGLAEIEMSLRLGYEHKGNRKFQPFVAIEFHQLFGTTKQLQARMGKDDRDFNAVLGIHSWF